MYQIGNNHYTIRYTEEQNITKGSLYGEIFQERQSRHRC